MSDEKLYTAADLEKARADERERCIDAVLSLGNYQGSGVAIKNPVAWNCAIAEAVREICTNIPPLGETREEAERRVRRETIKKAREGIVHLIQIKAGHELENLCFARAAETLDAIAEGKA